MGKGYDVNDYVKARDKIFESIRAEMIGPGSEDIGPDIKYEVLSDSPLKRYSSAILYPMGEQQRKENDEKHDIYNNLEEESNLEDNVNTDDEPDDGKQKDRKNHVNYQKGELENDLDEQISMANQFLPSAMGFTFFIKGKTDEIYIRVNCARYRYSTYQDCCVLYEGPDDIFESQLGDYIYKDGNKLKLKCNINYEDINKLKGLEFISNNYELINALYKLAGQCTDKEIKKYGYVRVPLDFENPVKITVPDNSYERLSLKECIDISVYSRSYGRDVTSITLMVINSKEGSPSVENTLFQPELYIRSQDNPNLTFTEYLSGRPRNMKNSNDDEDESIILLYRNKKIYATGHGVAVHYNIDSDTGIGEIHTDFMPEYEVPRSNFDIEEIKNISDRLLSMKNLCDKSDLDRRDKINLLEQFTDAYEKWLGSLENELNSLDEKFRNAANRHIKDSKTCLCRIKDGIKLLDTDDDVYTAFSLMNRAMMMQRVHSGKKERFPDDSNIPFERIDYSKVKDEDASWRSFQLAFILMCLRSMRSPDSEDRDIVDLIWVPTGGGKTEAYLGLTAYTIFLRRLLNLSDSGGTTIIMRYTLRLLAAQQFIRASILICACEVIRRQKEYKLGNEEISIGLWIGSTSTPNKNTEAKQCINELAKAYLNDLSEKKGKYNKFQLLKCPWCGTKLIKEVDGKKTKGMWGYRYSNGKTIMCCTEEECEFYDHLPIHVVDDEVYRNLPTLLFSTVDKFAMMTWRKEVSKFFALDYQNKNKSPELIIQDELHLISGPLGTIVGLYETAIDAMCSHKGIKPKIISSTATIRRAGEQCKGLYTREVKQFPPPGLNAENSFFIREISTKKAPGRMYTGIMASGKTQTTLEIRLMAAILQKIYLMDLPREIKDKYWTLVGYFNSIRELGKGSTLVDDDIKDAMRRLATRLANRYKTRPVFSADELTSRVPSNLITKTLERLEVELSENNIKNKIYPVNVLLASNMISVGVDVSRLSLMTIVGQPKLTSEYIQASSRIGRKYPGLVFTVYDGAKSRDRSHYEQFYSYHESFYRFVEPTSVTPFSDQARERALHAVLISMIRHILGLNSETGASELPRRLEDLNSIKENIIQRACDVDSNVRGEVLSELEVFIEEWYDKIDSLIDNELLTYSVPDKKHLIRPYSKNDGTNARQTLQSMRNVDSESGVSILVFGDEDNGESKKIY